MGLNFQTQTIINSNLDLDSSKAGKEVALFEVAENALRIKRDFVFAKDDHRGKVLAVRKAEGKEAKPCKATINFSQLGAIDVKEGEKKYCRLDIYLGVEGAEPFIYATPWVQKGRPFWVEFTVTYTNKTTIAKVVADMIKKNHLFQIDKDLIDVTGEGTTLTLTGATEYQRFRKIEVRAFNDTDDDAELVAEIGDTGITLNEPGENAFGTYSQLVKDLRLPTAANYQWSHIRQAETPIVGAIYNQYIIEYAAPATNGGTQFVGHKGTSHTTHVFWVKNDEELITAWEEALNTIDPDKTATETTETGELDA